MSERHRYPKALLFAILAAALYALNAPLSKLLMEDDAVAPSMMAGLLYLGAGLGMGAIWLIQKSAKIKRTEAPLTRSDLPYTLLMILLDIAAPILLMLGIKGSSAASASLLNNFEIVATSLIALLLFREKITKKPWLAIGLVTASSILLSIERGESFSLSAGSLMVLGACICWGFENNCTRRLSEKNPLEIVIIKGFGSGAGALIVAFIAGESLPALWPMVFSMLLGFVAYGLSIFFYIYAQRTLGAAKTSAYYAFAPFIGALLSLLLFQKIPDYLFWLALPIMIAGAWLAAGDGSK